MGQYELLYIIPAKYTDAEIATLIEKMNGIVKAAGAKVLETHSLGKRKLAYPIDHVRHGNYVLNYVEMEHPIVAKLNDVLRLSADILRHLIVTRDPALKTIPSIIEVEERRNEEGEIIRERRPVPVQQKVHAGPPKEAMSTAELDKKLDEILTEEVA
jgi:small subunit ribosomal protein S6